MFEVADWLEAPMLDDKFTAEELAGAEFVDAGHYLFEETTADVVASHATLQPFGTETLGPLMAVPFAELSEEGRLAALQCLSRFSAHIDALRTELIALNAGPEPVDERGRREDFVAHDVSVATKTSVYAADRVVGLSRDLTSRLKATAKAMRRGEVTLDQARYLSEETRHLPLAVARDVETAVLRFAWRQGPARFRDSVRTWIAKKDPNFEKQAKEARKECSVEHTPNPDGTGDLYIRGPLEITAALSKALDAYAIKTKGRLGGTADQRKVAGLRDMIDAYLGSGAAPLQHGRLPILNVTIDAATLLGLANRPCQIPGVGMVPAEVGRWLMADGAPLRRFLIDATTGALLDYGTDTWIVPPKLADFLCAQHVKSAAPHSNVDSRTSDMEHQIPHNKDGPTNPTNNTPVDRRWHRLKTHGDWDYRKDPTTGIVTWRNKTGLSYRIEPHDYRSGP